MLSFRGSLVLAGLVALLGATRSEAQATRTWVSGVGDDANPCSRTAPCKTFAGAISKTAAGGEISVLDPGGFGAVTITKAITINGDGTLAGILAAGTNGVVINAGAADKVVLRNLSLAGAGTGLDGIRYLAGGEVSLENVTITGFRAAASHGVEAALSGSGRLVLKDVAIRNSEAGVKLNASSGTLHVSFDGVSVVGTNGHGIEAVNGVIATVRDSEISGNAFSGVRVAGPSTVLSLENVSLSQNLVGVNSAVAGARTRISNCTVVNNATGIAIGPGAFVDSAGNNRVAGNGATTPPNGAFVVQ